MSGQQQIPYLEERKLIKRWSGPWPMLANMAFTLLIFAVTWWVFQDPRGIMRFYTPYVGYNYCRWWLIILIWMAYIFDFWPFRRDWVRSAHPLQKGLVLALVSVGIMIAMIHGFFEGVLGNLAFAYFNPAQLQKLGLTDFYSTEYAAQACMMFAVIASWISPAWLVALEGQPWAGLSQPVRGFSIWLGTFCLSLLIYFMTMHNHMGILYYPWQYFTAICPPYWEHFAETVSANFHVAWIMCCTVVVWFMEGIWERFPFTMIKTPWLRRLALFFGIIAISWALCMFFWYMLRQLAQPLQHADQRARPFPAGDARRHRDLLPLLQVRPFRARHPEGLLAPAAVPHDPHDLADQHLADQLVVHGRLAGLAARIQDRRGLRRRGAPSGRQRRLEPRHAARRDHRPRRGRDRLLRHRGPAAPGERNFHSGSIGGTIWTDANS